MVLALWPDEERTTGGGAGVNGGSILGGRLTRNIKTNNNDK